MYLAQETTGGGKQEVNKTKNRLKDTLEKILHIIFKISSCSHTYLPLLSVHSLLEWAVLVKTNKLSGVMLWDLDVMYPIV